MSTIANANSMLNKVTIGAHWWAITDSWEPLVSGLLYCYF